MNYKHPPMKKVYVLIGILLLIWQFPVLVKHYARHRHVEAVLPTQNLPLQKSVSIYLNEYQIPFIHAQTDRDLAFTLGLVHAHYRLPQIEMSRIIAKGELSSLFGPKATDVDTTLRIIDFGKSAKEIFQSYPASTKEWLQAYLHGLNYYIANTKPLPWDLKVMHIEPKAWTMEDLITMYRMASSDVNWVYLATFISELKNTEWEKIWNLYIQFSQGSVPSNTEAIPSIPNLIQGFSKSGSNSLVVGGSKSASGAGMIASDPHVSIFLPNLWFLCGFQSPSYHSVGLMVPGVPFVSLGRNIHVAWGATNMYSISSYLYKLDAEEQKSIQSTEVSIPTRFTKDKRITVRNSTYGPIISDSPIFKTDETLALHWLGHKPSDEVTTFLEVMKSKNWSEFEKAFHTYAVLGLNYLYTDDQGNIGYVPAFTQPMTKSAVKKLWYTTKEFSNDVIPESKLSRIYNPKQGFIASSNNRPVQVSQDWGWFYAPNDRIIRQGELMHLSSKTTIKDLEELQLDTGSVSALSWIEWMGKNVNTTVMEHEFFKRLDLWNGRYDKELQEPVIFDFLIYELANRLLSREFNNESSIEKILHSTFLKDWIQKKLTSMSLQERSKVFLDAFEQIRTRITSYPNWGLFHQIKLQYLFGYLPWIGKAYELKSYPASGSSDTLYKRAYNMDGNQAFVSYGSSARHISDMSDPDANYFVMYGAQNGYPFNPKNADQIQMWEDGKYIQFPMRLESIQKQFKQTILLNP
jgi:penicillin amidase